MRIIVLAAIAALAAASPAVLPFAGDVFKRAEACAERRIGATAELRTPGNAVESASELYGEVREQVRGFVSCVRRERRPTFKRAPDREIG
jgi:hypothetical protein